MKEIMKVVAQYEVQEIMKKDGTTMKKCMLLVRKIGNEYEDSFAVTLLGNLASCKFYPGELVYAALHFTTNEYNGNVYQEVTARDIIKLNK